MSDYILKVQKIYTKKKQQYLQPTTKGSEKKQN